MPSEFGVNWRFVMALTVSTALSIQACASGGRGNGTGSGNVITREMIGDPTDQNAFTVVQRLRPGWLRPRGQATIRGSRPSFPQVHLDNMRFGSIDDLYRINAVQIDRIEFLGDLDATTRFGLGYDGGVIIVHTVNSGTTS